MMTTISLLLTLTLLSLSIKHVFLATKGFRIMNRALSIHSKGEKKINKVAIVIPIYQELSIAASAVEYYSNLASSLGVDVFFVATIKEGDMNSNPTFQRFNQLTRHNKYLSVHLYSQKIGAKADQVNWLIQKYSSNYTYFGIFDADSRPDPRGIDFVMKCRKKPEALQMPTLYKPLSSPSFTTLSFALYQTRWTYCYEIPNWYKWQTNPKNDNFMYLVGHGLFIRPNYSLPNRTLTEDLDFGYILSANHASIQIVPFFDVASVPSSFRSLISQSSRWYSGQLLSPFHSLPLVKKAKRPISFLSKFMFRQLSSLNWLLGVVLLILVFIVSLDKPLILSVWTMAAMLYLFQFLLVARNLHMPVRSFVLLPLRILVDNVGPVLSMLHLLMNLLGIRQLKFNKTKR